MFKDCLPSWCEEFLVKQQEFSRAYNNISSKKRALLKKHISELSKWYNFYKNTLQSEKRTLYWTQNWVTTIYKRPLDYVLIGLFEGFASPALLLSAVLPPKIVGVNKVLVFKYTENYNPWMDSLLLSLELAGVEEVYDFSVQEIQALLKEIHRYPIQTSWICFEQSKDFNYSLSGGKLPSQIDLIPLVVPQKCGIWIDSQNLPEFESLEFAHPEVECEVWSSESRALNDLSENFVGEKSRLRARNLVCEKSRLREISSARNLVRRHKKKNGTLEEFCQKDFDLVWAPPHLHTELVTKFPVVLSPGQECSWIWQNLGLERFQTLGIAFSGSQ